MKETPIPSGKYVESNNIAWYVRLPIKKKNEREKNTNFPPRF